MLGGMALFIASLLLLFVPARALPCAQADPSPDEISAGEITAPEITASDLQAHVERLASDELEGRATASPGARAAAEYMAAVLAESGVSPAGPAGSFFQVVPLERWNPLQTAELVVESSDGSRSTELDGIGFQLRTHGPTTGDLRLVSAPQEGPLPALEQADSLALFIDASRTEALERLELAGRPAGRGLGLVVVPGRPRDGSRAHSVEPGERGRLALRRERRSPAIVRANGELLESLRAGRVRTLRLDAGRELEQLSCQNVLGRIPGRGPLAQETVVLSAHYDHLGRVEEHASESASAGLDPAGVQAASGAERDRVFNGADDDASGCAAVLELARVLAAAAPERTVIVLLATGEERGLLGTEYYLEHPAEPLESTVLNLNFEMVGRPDPAVGGAGRLWLTGWERSNLGPTFVQAGVVVVPDQRPEQDFFRRSDNYAFAKRGIVAQTLSSYDLHQDYHTVEDEANRLDYEHMQQALVGALDAVMLVVSSELRPEWMPGGDPSVE